MKSPYLKAAQKIAYDISDRAGLGDDWDLIDNETKEQILLEWSVLIEKEMMKAKNDKTN